MTCKNHQFISMGEYVHYQKLHKHDGSKIDNITPIRGLAGVKAGCILCGEIRAILETGDVVTLVNK